MDRVDGLRMGRSLVLLIGCINEKLKGVRERIGNVCSVCPLE